MMLVAASSVALILICPLCSVEHDADGLDFGGEVALLKDGVDKSYASI